MSFSTSWLPAAVVLLLLLATHASAWLDTRPPWAYEEERVHKRALETAGRVGGVARLSSQRHDGNRWGELHVEGRFGKCESYADESRKWHCSLGGLTLESGEAAGWPYVRSSTHWRTLNVLSLTERQLAQIDANLFKTLTCTSKDDGRREAYTLTFDKMPSMGAMYTGTDPKAWATDVAKVVVRSTATSHMGREEFENRRGRNNPNRMCEFSVRVLKLKVTMGYRSHSQAGKYNKEDFTPAPPSSSSPSAGEGGDTISLTPVHIEFDSDEAKEEFGDDNHYLQCELNGKKRNTAALLPDGRFSNRLALEWQGGFSDGVVVSCQLVRRRTTVLGVVNSLASYISNIFTQKQDQKTAVDDDVYTDTKRIKLTLFEQSRGDVLRTRIPRVGRLEISVK